MAALTHAYKEYLSPDNIWTECSEPSAISNHLVSGKFADLHFTDTQLSQNLTCVLS